MPNLLAYSEWGDTLRLKTSSQTSDSIFYQYLSTGKVSEIMYHLVDHLSGAVDPNLRESGCVGDAKPGGFEDRKIQVFTYHMRHPISCDILQIRPVIGSNSGTEVESSSWKHILTSEVFNEIEPTWNIAQCM